MRDISGCVDMADASLIASGASADVWRGNWSRDGASEIVTCIPLSQPIPHDFPRSRSNYSVTSTRTLSLLSNPRPWVILWSSRQLIAYLSLASPTRGQYLERANSPKYYALLWDLLWFAPQTSAFPRLSILCERPYYKIPRNAPCCWPDKAGGFSPLVSQLVLKSPCRYLKLRLAWPICTVVTSHTGTWRGWGQSLISRRSPFLFSLGQCTCQRQPWCMYCGLWQCGGHGRFKRQDQLLCMDLSMGGVRGSQFPQRRGTTNKYCDGRMGFWIDGSWGDIISPLNIRIISWLWSRYLVDESLSTGCQGNAKSYYLFLEAADHHMINTRKSTIQSGWF